MSTVLMRKILRMKLLRVLLTLWSTKREKDNTRCLQTSCNVSRTAMRHQCKSNMNSFRWFFDSQMMRIMLFNYLCHCCTSFLHNALLVLLDLNVRILFSFNFVRLFVLSLCLFSVIVFFFLCPNASFVPLDILGFVTSFEAKRMPCSL
jgi:hypothetical protein